MKRDAEFSSDPDDAGLDVVERTAAEWVLRHESGLTPAERAEFARWLREDPSHRAVWEEMRQTDDLLGKLAPATTAASRTAQRSWWRRAVLPAGLAAAAAVAILIGMTSREAAPEFSRSVATVVGGSRRLELPDGSVVQLNTDSAVDVKFYPQERRIVLERGEAYFRVAHDTARPFWVQAGPVAVRAVGTEFNVRRHPDAVDVLVTEGKVRVVEGAPRSMAAAETAADASPLLTSGHLARVGLDRERAVANGPVTISPVETRAMHSALAWRDGGLEFVDRPLGEVVAEFNRYNRHPIVIADPTLAARRFGGAFASHEPAPLIELLEQSFGVVAETRGGETILRAAK
jgi:transmembrane sensor